MKLDKKLNLVVPVQTSVGEVFVHSAPIGLQVFEKFYMLLGKTFSLMYSEGLQNLGGPRVAAYLLRDIAKRDGGDEGAEETESLLINEIKRLTNVAVPAPEGKGWVTIPFDGNEAREILDEQDRREIEGFLVFFTLVSSLHTRIQIPAMLKSAGNIWGFHATSLSGTAWKDSLPISTPAEISAQTETHSPTPI